jgi:hypothetical protein
LADARQIRVCCFNIDNPKIHFRPFQVLSLLRSRKLFAIGLVVSQTCTSGKARGWNAQICEPAYTPPLPRRMPMP